MSDDVRQAVRRAAASQGSAQAAPAGEDLAIRLRHARQRVATLESHLDRLEKLTGLTPGARSEKNPSYHPDVELRYLERVEKAHQAHFDSLQSIALRRGAA